MNLLELLQQDFTLRRVAASHGGEYAGPCPWCGGIDRFRLWPFETETGRFWCRGCNKKGDVITYLREYRKLSYKQACELLGLSDKLKRQTGPRPMQAIGGKEPKKETWQPRTVEAPGAAWQAAAESFISKSILNLSASPAALQFLLDRGLTTSTIAAARIGFNPTTYYMPRDFWGLANG